MKPFNITDLRKEKGVSEHCPITHLNSPTVFETKEGDVGSVIHVEGHAFDTETLDVLNQLKLVWHQTLCSLNEQFCVYVHKHRYKVDTTLKAEFTNKTAQTIDEAYQQQFKDNAMYRNDIYITLLFKGITHGKKGKGLKLLTALGKKAVSDERAAQRKNAMKQLRLMVQQWLVSLDSFSPRLLGTNDNALGYSELTSFIGTLVNAGKTIRFDSPNATNLRVKDVKRLKKESVHYPEGRIAQIISHYDTDFGQWIVFEGPSQHDKRYGTVLIIKTYSGTHTHDVMFDPLMALDCECISTHSFAVLSRAEADKALVLQGKKLENVKDAGVSQSAALHHARDALQCGEFNMGLYQHSLLLTAKDIDTLEHSVNSAVKCYQDVGITVIRERLGLQPAYWSQLPGNLHYMTRTAQVTSENVADFSALHNYRTGFYDDNHLGSAMTIAQTLSRTPHFLNFHAQGAKANPSPGHTVIIGGNGSGKTVFMAFSHAQLNRYGGRAFFFDRNRGLDIYVRAMGGRYVVLSPEHHETIRMNPLQLPDSKDNRAFCRQWFSQLLLREDEKELDDETLIMISDTIDYAFEHIPKDKRTLTAVSRYLPVDFARWHRLRRWLLGDGRHPEGEYAYLFDNTVDDLRLTDIMGFDMTHFLDKEPPTVLAAVSMYLFHLIEQSNLDGKQLVSIYLDEGWQYLNNHYWQTKLKMWLPTLRKLNMHLIFATQSPSSVVDSPISSMLLDNCATLIFFSNPQAKRTHYIEGFNLTEAEFACIADNTPQSRLFIYKQGNTSSLLRLNLGGLGPWLKVFSGTSETVKEVEDLIKVYGDNPEQWLSHFLKPKAEEGIA